MTDLLCRGLAAAALAGDWSVDGVHASLLTALGLKRGLRGCARAVIAAYPRPPLDAPRELAQFLAHDVTLQDQRQRAHQRGRPWQLQDWVLVPQQMRPTRWHVPPLNDVAELADLLQVEPTQLEWLADPKDWGRRTTREQLQPYRRRWLQRSGRTPRLVEAPIAPLRHVQRRLLDHVLTALPTHHAAHGFVPGRSVVTAVEPHAGAAVLVRLDLTSFFASIDAARVYGVMRLVGYPEDVAHQLAALMTTRTPLAILSAMPAGGVVASRFDLRQVLGAPHLPVGAPTSGAIANLVAWSLDVRLHAYCERLGFTYTRYADDLIISGDDRPTAHRIVRAVTRIVAEEGFSVNPAKTTVRCANARQSALGLVLNSHPAVPRREYDQLRAVLHNAATHGANQANREGHRHWREYLQGRIGWVGTAHPERAAKLRALYDQIDWAS